MSARRMSEVQVGKIETEGIGRLTLEELLKMELFLGVRRNSKPGGLRQRTDLSRILAANL